MDPGLREDLWMGLACCLCSWRARALAAGGSQQPWVLPWETYRSLCKGTSEHRLKELLATQKHLHKCFCFRHWGQWHKDPEVGTQVVYTGERLVWLCWYKWKDFTLFFFLIKNKQTPPFRNWKKNVLKYSQKYKWKYQKVTMNLIFLPSWIHFHWENTDRNFNL